VQLYFTVRRRVTCRRIKLTNEVPLLLSGFLEQSQAAKGKVQEGGRRPPELFPSREVAWYVATDDDVPKGRSAHAVAGELYVPLRG
jgi:hypothetical protein